MSADLVIWDPGIGLSPDAPDFYKRIEVYLDPENPDPPSPEIEAFVSRLTARYPDVGTETESGDRSPWSFMPLLAGARGGVINITMHFEGYGQCGQFVVETAHSLGLHVFDPQGPEIYAVDGTTIVPPLEGA